MSRSYIEKLKTKCFENLTKKHNCDIELPEFDFNKECKRIWMIKDKIWMNFGNFGIVIHIGFDDGRMVIVNPRKIEDKNIINAVNYVKFCVGHCYGFVYKEEDRVK